MVFLYGCIFYCTQLIVWNIRKVKARMGTWAASLNIPELLEFEPSRLNSHRFWRATEDIISEKQLQKERKSHRQIDTELLNSIPQFLHLEDKPKKSQTTVMASGVQNAMTHRDEQQQFNSAYCFSIIS